jgi:hypothetical protein
VFKILISGKREKRMEIENSVIRSCAATLMGKGISKYLGNGGHYVSTKLRRCDYPQRGVVLPKGRILSHTRAKMSKFVNVKLFLLPIPGGRAY